MKFFYNQFLINFRQKKIASQNTCKNSSNLWCLPILILKKDKNNLRF